MPVASLVHQLVQSLVGHGYGEDDFATLLVLQARSAGLELVSENAEVSDGLGAGRHERRKRCSTVIHRRSTSRPSRQSAA